MVYRVAMRGAVLGVWFVAACSASRSPAPATPSVSGSAERIYDTESIGPLRPGASADAVIATLGAPRARTAPELEGATAQYASVWDWADASCVMVADTPGGPWSARLITVSGASTLETKRHTRVGSSREEVERIYPRSPDSDGHDPDTYLVGSMYAGLLFRFEHDRVASITFGPLAF